MAGGLDPILGTNNITIMRFDDQGKPISINTNLKDIIARSDARSAGERIMTWSWSMKAG